MFQDLAKRYRLIQTTNKDVDQADGYMSLDFWEETQGGDENWGILRIQVVFKAMAFERSPTQRVYTHKQDMQGVSPSAQQNIDYLEIMRKNIPKTVSKEFQMK